MSGIVLDSNVVSELMRKKPDGRVLDWLDTFEVADLWLASISITEIERGILRLSDQDRVASLRTQFARIATELFADRIIPFDRRCAEATALYLVHSKSLHPAHHLADGIIAGSAITHRLQVATRNVSDYNPELVEIVNPWDFAPSA